MKQDKAEKIIKKAEKKAQKATAQVQVASKKAEAAAKKQAAQAEKKAARAAQSAEKKAAQKTKKAEQAAKKAQLAAKKAEEKKAKALAKLAAKATTTTGEGGEGEGKGAGKKKKGKKKLLLIVAPILVAAVGVGAFFFLRGGGKEEEELPPEPIPAPAEYVLNEAHISALPVWGEDVLVYQEEVLPETPAQPEEDAAAATADTADGQEGEEGQEGEAPQDAAPAEEAEVVPLTLYRYEGLQSPKDLVAAYTALMTSADAGFSTVDETLLRIDPPEIGDRGSVQLARNAPALTEGGEACVHSLLLSWDATSCTVTLDTPDGMVRDPKPEATPMAPSRGLSDLETIHPSKLGLPGESMDAYELMPQEGSVLIAGNPSPCMRVNIYGEDGQIAGSYFISGDGHLYKLDDTRNAVVELDWE